MQQQQSLNKCQLIRTSCAKVMNQAKHVKISQLYLNEFVSKLYEEQQKQPLYKEFEDYDCHLGKEATLEDIVNYIFVMDSLNFCFWPSNLWEYEDLAQAIKNLHKMDRKFLTAEFLQSASREFIKENIFGGHEFPLLDERWRILNEIGERTVKYFDGKFINIVQKSQNSAVQFLDYLTSFFNNFQDTAIYNGQQICFYKRSQILIGDLYAATKPLWKNLKLDEQKSHIGYFNDISELTMFPDYRVPQILYGEKIFEYSEELTKIIKNKETIPHGSKFEIEIRAATIIAVEDFKRIMSEKGENLMSIEVDWILWQKGEDLKDSLPPHHRVLSIFY